jgi:hypothetical protein
MYTIRLTRPLLAQFAADDDEPASDVEPTTRLGDWYVMPKDIGHRSLLLCTSEKSLLSIVLPADRLADLPEQLVTALVGVLHRLGVPKQAIVDEVDAMTSGGVGPAVNRSTLGAMRGLAARAEAFLERSGDDLDVAALYEELGAYRTRADGGQTASERALALLGGRSTAAAAAATPARKAKKSRS